MQKKLYTFITILCFCISVSAQTTILDFETPETSTVFQYFGSPLDGTVTSVIENPNKTGINQSNNVTKYVKPGVSEVWAGAFSNPNPKTLIDVVNNGEIKLKVHMNHIGNVTLKLEGSSDGGENWIISVPNTKINEWEELTFDTSLPSIEGPNKPAKGHVYTRMVIFFDFGTAGTGSDVTSYFDDAILSGGEPLVCKSILDFETAATGTTFQYFGSPLDGTTNETIDNPNPTGINTSAKVAKFVKPEVAEVWAGAFSNPNPTEVIDLVNNSKIKIKVHMDHIGNLALKLEGSADGPNWVIQVPNTKINEWEELEFDANLPSIEGPNAPAKGHVYTRLVLFFDFGIAGNGAVQTYYFDDICQIGSNAPQAKNVKFTVDMNNYTQDFDKVYLSGTFNNWAGDANALSDDDGDGIWTGALDLPVGLYEYKVTLDNWKAQENFLGTEECTVTDPSGQFTNRKLIVSTNAELPKFCFNSCYACGDEIKLTFKLGKGDATPSAEGFWLAGGGNFEVPGGRYKMTDTDNDGVYEIVVPRKKGFSSYYTFANGACPDYSCKEILEGLPCGNPDNFNDRFLPIVNSNTVIATCFGKCSIDAQCTPSSTDNVIIANDLFTIEGNPTMGQSTLVFKTNEGKKTVQMMDSFGKLLSSKNYTQFQSSVILDGSSLAKGMYFINVTTEGKSQTMRWVRL